MSETGTVTTRKEVADMGITQLVLSNKVRVNLKSTDFEKGKIRLSARIGSGKLTQPKDKPMLDAFAQAVFEGGGLGKHSNDDLQQILAGRNVSSSLAIGEDAFTLGGSTTPADFTTQCQLMCASITDPGFLKAYVESTDDAESADDAEHRLPALTKGQPLTADALEALGHSTQPPARYTEPSLVKALEELGIGRPSTYASIMQTIQDRGYVFKRGQALIPSFLAFAVVGLLENHFPRLVDFAFTAAMEDELQPLLKWRAKAWRQHGGVPKYASEVERELFAAMQAARLPETPKWREAIVRRSDWGQKLPGESDMVEAQTSTEEQHEPGARVTDRR